MGEIYGYDLKTDILHGVTTQDCTPPLSSVGIATPQLSTHPEPKGLYSWGDDVNRVSNLVV